MMRCWGWAIECRQCIFAIFDMLSLALLIFIVCLVLDVAKPTVDFSLKSYNGWDADLIDGRGQLCCKEAAHAGLSVDPLDC